MHQQPHVYLSGGVPVVWHKSKLPHWLATGNKKYLLIYFTFNSWMRRSIQLMQLIIITEGFLEDIITLGQTEVRCFRSFSNHLLIPLKPTCYFISKFKCFAETFSRHWHILSVCSLLPAEFDPKTFTKRQISGVCAPSHTLLTFSAACFVFGLTSDCRGWEIQMDSQWPLSVPLDNALTSCIKVPNREP